MASRLSQEHSLYLRQHAQNPVDWYPWSTEALAAARAADKPIFLSIGYSACHWCHVMERESFEDREVAAYLDAHFISIKVDREERPDLDELYMSAVQLLSGRGGWPMSVFLLPDGRPFYGGTYYPPKSVPGRLGFLPLLQQLAGAWRERRTEVEEAADDLMEHLQNTLRQRPIPTHAVLNGTVLMAEAVEDLEARFDPACGGFGDAPKFPPHHALRLLDSAVRRGKTPARALLCKTLDHLALGGIYDHVGGGFHRYSTDALWLVPHFEKMLYDNALLARVYARAFTLTGNDAYARITREVCDWVLETLRTDGGGFQSALDADSEGEEGKYYLWSYDEARAHLGAEGSARYHALPEGNYHDEVTRQRTGKNILHLHVGAHPAPLPGTHNSETQAALLALRRVRAERIAPHKDHKVITAWNGLMIGALAVAGDALGEPRYVGAARAAAEACLAPGTPEQALWHQCTDGHARIPAFLDDYAYLADGLLDLWETTGEPRWREDAAGLLAVLCEGFWDEQDSGFFYTSHRHEALIGRTKALFDSALPSANGVAARALLRLGEPWTTRGMAMLYTFHGLMRRAPQAMATWIETASIFVPEEAPPFLPTPAHYSGRPGDEINLAFTLYLPPHWHLSDTNSTEPPLLPTRYNITMDVPGEVGSLVFPHVLSGTCTFTLPLRLAPTAMPGSYTLHLEFHFQPCSEQVCYAPQRRHVSVQVAIRNDRVLIHTQKESST